MKAVLTLTDEERECLSWRKVIKWVNIIIIFSLYCLFKLFVPAILTITALVTHACSVKLKWEKRMTGGKPVTIRKVKKIKTINEVLRQLHADKKTVGRTPNSHKESIQHNMVVYWHFRLRTFNIHWAKIQRKVSFKNCSLGGSLGNPGCSSVSAKTYFEYILECNQFLWGRIEFFRCHSSDFSKAI